ncbi:putative ATP-dependent RNA helicase TDRD12 isoform X2 [Esox lucius]|uniref:putative ATP-dependent RNA helicase TDRD12 isoform X2 n=1 Tax=Esox lucius TaxID=8010 RepID=UPI001476999A|nr:putative ATP-dependent RNA helicase TDRD12 isoform X2 [Esox lucius]
MLEIRILKVENPSCLWGRLVKGIEGTENKKEYDDLQVKMNLFYHEVNLDVQKVKPSSIEEGQVCVVYWSALRSWCRVIIESLFKGTTGTKAMCFLVDHGERVVVSYEEILAPLETFLQLPFWVRKFKLAGVLPMTLLVSGDCLQKAELIPSTQWDSSATRYLHNLLRASTQMEAVLRDTQADCDSIELYLTVKNVKICVNDELVLKKFAFFKSQKTEETDENVDRSPAILACDIFSETQNFLATDGCTVSSRSDFFPRLQDPTADANVTDHCQTTPRQKAPVEFSKPKKSLASGGKPFKGDKKAVQNVKSKTFSEIDGDEEASVKDAGEDGNTSLVSDLLQNLNLFRLMKFLNPASITPRAVIPNGGINEDEGGAGEQFSEISEKEPVNAAQPMEPQTEAAVCKSPTAEHEEQPCTELSGLVEDGTHECNFAKQPITDVELACAQLLQFLNPDPLNQTGDSSEAVCSDPSKNGIVVHSAISLDACTSLANAPITDTLRRILMRKGYSDPSVAESYCWPAVARGCDTVVISHSGDRPLTYIPPFLAHMQLSSVFSAVSSRTGPIAVILCPGWEKAQAVFDLLEESHTVQDLHPMLILVGLGKDEAKNVKIQNNFNAASQFPDRTKSIRCCLLYPGQVIVSTPFTLARLLGSHCFQLLRLCHLVLDEVDLLFSRAPDEMASILQHFKKVTAGEERTSCPRQIIAAGKRWSPHLEGLLRDHMSSPAVVITVTEEAALYGNVHQMILLCLDSSKMSVLLAGLDLIPDVAQKTLFITNSAEEVEQVFKAVSKTSAFSLKAHEGLTYQFDFVIEQWKKPIGPGTHVILVTNNECIKALGIRDATCVVHYSFPSSPKLFGRRLFCMSENFRNLSDEGTAAESQAPVAKSVLLLSEKNAHHVIGVLRYLKRTEALLPTELLHFAQGVLQAKEEQKTDRPLCLYLKSFGFCSVCPDRHSISPTLDHPVHPELGTILVLPLYIKTASVYYGRIVRKKEDLYESLAEKMTAYYATEKLGANEVLEGGVYGLQEEELYHRVRVTSAPDKGDRLFNSVRALFLDEGREQEVKAHQLLQLPAQFHSLPPQALEIVVCRAMPIDAEVDWNPKVIRAISQKIRGQQHQAKVALSLRNTVFVDPMVRMTHMPGLKTFINEYNVHTEILSTGMGTSNPTHLDRLKELCQKAGPKASTGEIPLGTGPDGSEASLEDKVQAAEEALVHSMRAAVENLHDGSGEPSQRQTIALQAHEDVPLLPVDPKVSGHSSQPPINQAQPLPKPQTKVPVAVVSNLSEAEPPTLVDKNQIPAPLPTPSEDEMPATTPADPKAVQWRCLLGNLNGTTHQQGYSALQGFPPRDWISNVDHPVANGHWMDDEQIDSQNAIHTEDIIRVDKINTDAPKRFHPQIKWFQREDTVMLNVLLREPVEQTCEFFSDRVVYSARVNDKLYHADLELHSSISVDKCSWEMKCNEPVIRLVKEERGSWKRLLKQKSPFISLDFNRFEDNAMKTSNGLCVVGHAGEEGCYFTSDSDSDSD